MPLTIASQLVASDLAAVDQLIQEHASSSIELITTLSRHIINSGGKRLRPLLVLLSANACGYQGTDHIHLAAALEYFHTATLLHDDVVDESTLRRGKETANHIWGSKASILVGDYLFTQAFQMVVNCANLKLLKLLAGTARVMTCGEVNQLTNCHNPSVTEQQYLGVIHDKTAELFATAAQIGPMLAEGNAAQEQAMRDYGMSLGMAFQIVDDVLDYASSSNKIGKNIGDDLNEGKLTLPLIHVLNTGTAAQRELVQQAVLQGTTEQLPAILDAIQATGAIAHTKQVAAQQVDSALTALQPISDSAYKEALIGLARYAISREN